MTTTINIYNKQIKWPTLCVNCYERPAVTAVRMSGRSFVTSSLYVPYCSDCAREREEGRKLVTRSTFIALLPFLTLGPIALVTAWLSEMSRETTLAVNVLTVVLPLWMFL